MKKLLFLFIIVLVSSFLSAQCFTNVVSNNSTVILRKSDGTLWARGDNNTGLAGNGTTNDVAELTQIGSDSDWSNEFCAGWDVAFAIKNNGTLWYWGSNFQYTNLSLTPTQVGTDTDWVKVTSSEKTMAAIKQNGTLWTMGSNLVGQLGIANLNDNLFQTAPVQVGASTDWQNVYSGLYNIYAIKNNGTLWSWGDFVGLGYQTTIVNQFRYPNQVGTDTWRLVSGSKNYMTLAFGIKTNGSLWGWGSSPNYPVINGNSNSTLPVQVGTDTDWKTVQVNNSFVIALKNNHTRWGWGNNWQYVLGNGSNINVASPTQLDLDTDWHIINIATIRSNALKLSGTHYCWPSIWPALSSGVYQFPTPTVIFQNCTLDNLEFTDKEFKIFPNPFNSFFNVNFESSSNELITVNIYNMLGKLVNSYENISINELNKVNFGEYYPSGVYNIIVIQGENTKSIKVIKN